MGAHWVISGETLTDTAFKRAAPREPDYKPSDVKALNIMIWPSGSRLWRHKHGVAGKERVSSYGLQWSRAHILASS